MDEIEVRMSIGPVHCEAHEGSVPYSFCSLLNDVLTVSMGLANLHARVRKWSISIAKHNQCLTPACPVILDRPDDYWRTRASGQSATMLAYYSPM